MIGLKINIGVTFVLGILSIVAFLAANMVSDILLGWSLVKIWTILFAGFIFASIIALVNILSMRSEGGI